MIMILDEILCVVKTTLLEFSLTVLIQVQYTVKLLRAHRIHLGDIIIIYFLGFVNKPTGCQTTSL